MFVPTYAMALNHGAHTSLMNSSGHGPNILNKAYTHVGIGIVSGGRYGMMFTQLFVGR